MFTSSWAYLCKYLYFWVKKYTGGYSKTTALSIIPAVSGKPTAVTMYVRSLYILVLLMMKNVGALASPVVTFNPNWNKIFTGESINMTCDVDSIEEGEVTYNWFKDGYWIHSGKTFTISSAQMSNSGSYQCHTSTGYSDSARLDVHSGYVILQASPYVYEGDNLTLRCHHYPGHTAKQTIFYKDDEVIKDWGPEDELHIDMTSSCKYKCTKQVRHHLLYYQPSDEVSVSVQELFSPPIISLSPHSVTEGDQMTLTCNTELSPLRKTPVLQFAFSRDGQNIQEYGLSNKYEIESAKLRDSAGYQCEVKTSSNRIKKMSATFTIQVKRNDKHEPINQSEKEAISKPGTSHFLTDVLVTSLVLALVLIFTILILLYRSRHSRHGNYQQASQEELGDRAENIYVDLDTDTRWKNSSQTPHKPNVNDLKTENDFIVC